MKRAAFWMIAWCILAGSASGEGTQEVVTTKDSNLLYVVADNRDSSFHFFKDGIENRLRVPEAFLFSGTGDVTLINKNICVAIANKRLILMNVSNLRNSYIDQRVSIDTELLEQETDVRHIVRSESQGKIYFINGQMLESFSLQTKEYALISDLHIPIGKIRNWYKETKVEPVNNKELKVDYADFFFDDLENILYINTQFLNLQVFSYNISNSELKYIVAGRMPQILHIQGETRLYFTDNLGIASVEPNKVESLKYLFKYKYGISRFKVLRSGDCFASLEEVHGIFPQFSGVFGLSKITDGKQSKVDKNNVPNDIVSVIDG